MQGFVQSNGQPIVLLVWRIVSVVVGCDHIMTKRQYTGCTYIRIRSFRHRIIYNEKPSVIALVRLMNRYQW